MFGVKQISGLVVPVVNERQRQTYYGALNYCTQEFLVEAYDKGNSESTIKFLNYLQLQYPQQRLAIFWDGASYHRSEELRTYLQSVNQDNAEDLWQITCTLLAPNAPEQNERGRHLVTSKTVYSPVLPSVQILCCC